MDNNQQIAEMLRSTPQLLRLSDGREVIVHRDDFNVSDMSITPPVRSRIKVHQRFADGDSFATYVKKYANKDSLLKADIGSRSVAVIIDYHGADDPKSAEHIASWTLQNSEEFLAWKSFEGKLHDQADFIRFLEENALDIVSPDPAKMLDLARDFEAIKKVNFKSSKKLGNGDREFLYAEETGTSDRISVPEKLHLRMPVYYGEEEHEIVVLFRYRMNEGGLKLGYEFHRMQPVLDAVFRLAVTRAAEATGITPLYGSHL